LGIIKNGKIVSLDFGSDSVKGVEGRYSKKGIIVDKSFIIELPKKLYTDGEITDLDQMTYLLKSGLSEYGIGQYDVHCVVNSSTAVMREVTLPKVTPEEIESIINYQLEDYIPINAEDYIVKYISLGSRVEEGIEKLLLMLVGIPRTIIQSHLTLMKNVNLKPAAMDYHGNAIAKLIANGGMINETYNPGGTVACIDIGAKSTSLSIVENGVIRVAREIETGFDYFVEQIGRKLPELEEEEIAEMIAQIDDIGKKSATDDNSAIVTETLRDSLYEMFDKLEMIFRYYKTREVSNEINLILLYGGLSRLKGLEKMIRDFFGIESIKLKSMEKVKLQGDLSQYANAIGGLIRYSEVKK
jgi:type IV pilus assembly protein PilM